MTQVRITPFQPFESRAGVDTVLSLSFRYDAGVVAVLKSALPAYTRATGRRNAGGWLAEHRCWFVERWAWPGVRAALVRAGCEVIDDGREATTPAPPRKPPPRNPPPTAATCALCRKLPALLEEWRWQMETRWSDDAGPVIDAGHELLREMLLARPEGERC